MTADFEVPTRAERQLIFDTLGYEPSPEQAAVHWNPCREKLVAGGWRGGKSLVGARELASMFWVGGKEALFWLVGQTYKDCEAEFNYLVQDLGNLGAIRKETGPADRSDLCAIELRTGGKIETRSARDPTKLGSVAPWGIIGCEASHLDYDTYLWLRGRIAEKRGWLLLEGTFESSLGWYANLFKKWQGGNEGCQSFSLPTWSNRKVFPGGRNDPEIKKLEAQYPADWFTERFGGVPCPPFGLVFKDFRATIHCGQYKYDPNEPVYLAVDPGYAGAYAVLALQVKGDEVFVVDELYQRGLVTEQMIEATQLKPWWKQVKGGTVDIAARQHQAMASVAEIWLQKAGIYLSSSAVKIADGIERLASFLKVNPITDQSPLHIDWRCRGLISEMGGCESPLPGGGVYKYKTDREGNTLGEEPDDKNNHSCKALIYFLVDRFGFARPVRKRADPVYSGM